MAQSSLPSSLHEAAVHNTPQLQLVILQICAQLQHERDYLKAENQMLKFQLSYQEDRCRKEQMRRMTTEHGMNERMAVLQPNTQTTLEKAAEVESLLKKIEEARQFKELLEKKDGLLLKLKYELKLVEKNVHIAIKDTKLIQNLAESRRAHLQLSLKQSREFQEKLLKSMKRANFFHYLPEERQTQRWSADAKIEAAEGQLQSAKEEIKELQAALLNATDKGASCAAKYQMSVEETINLKNSMKADKELLIQTWVTGNATVESLQFALEGEKNRTREEEANFLQEKQKLQQDLEVERKRSSSLQLTLDRNVNSGFTNMSTLIIRYADNQTTCQKEKQELLEKLGDEKRKCEEHNSAIIQNIMNVLQQLKDTTNANSQMSEHIKQTLLTNLESERSLRASLESSLSSSIPVQVDSLKNALQSYYMNMTKNFDKCVNSPKEDLKKLPFILRGKTMTEALIAAAWSGNVTELRILLDAGGDIESRDKTYQSTPLIWAAEYGQLEACRFLLERGASLKARATNWGNRTPLHAAAVNNRMPVIQLLVEMGADLTAKDNDGKTPAEVGNHTTKAWFRNRSG